MTDNPDESSRPIRRAYEHSHVRRGVSVLRQRAANPEPAALRRHRVALSRTLRRAGQHALTTRIARRCAQSMRNARLYDWLTREPDTAVIVIDLAETRTVGPVIAVVDRLGEQFGWVGSGTARVAGRFRRVGARRPVGVLATVVTALISLFWLYLWTVGIGLGVLVGVGSLALAAVLSSRVGVSAPALATPLSYRLLAAVVRPPAGPIESEMSAEKSPDEPSAPESAGAVGGTDPEAEEDTRQSSD